MKTYDSTGDLIWLVKDNNGFVYGVFLSEEKAYQCAVDHNLGAPSIPKDYFDGGSLLDIDLKNGSFEDYRINCDGSKEVIVNKSEWEKKDNE